MRRKAIVEIETDSTGEHCKVTCPHFAGACDAYRVSLKRVEGMHARWWRPDVCKKNEVKHLQSEKP